jgi:hypothetical protein
MGVVGRFLTGRKAASIDLPIRPSVSPTTQRNRASSHGDARHLPARIRTAPTGHRAALAVVLGMLLALFGTRITHVGANAANVLHELRLAAHEGRTELAHLTTIDAQACAVRHGLQTSAGTMIARLGAMETGINAGLKRFLRHDLLRNGSRNLTRRYFRMQGRCQVRGRFTEESPCATRTGPRTIW